MKKNVLKKSIFCILLTICLMFSAVLMTGCSRNTIGYSVKSLPSKIVYQIGEQVSFDGLKIQAISNDGIYTTCKFAPENISQVDTSTFGKKKVVVEKDNMSVSFYIYVANVIVNDSDDLKSVFEALNNGDIVYLRSGNYAPQNTQDERYKDVVINKSITIVGDGVDKTKFYGNFIVGANKTENGFEKINNFSNVTFLDVGFELKYLARDNFINYSGPYGNTDTNGAIRSFDTSNINIQNCSFKGYSYGVYADSTNGLTVKNCKFGDIKKVAIYTATDTQNTSIYKNIFADIAQNVISFENEKQSITGAIQLNFAKEGERGVIISKNVFNRIGLHTGDLIFFDQQSKIDANMTSNDIVKMSYINNAAVVCLLSSTIDDLQVGGIVLGTNNYSEALRIVYFGTKGVNTINANGVLDA